MHLLLHQYARWGALCRSRKQDPRSILILFLYIHRPHAPRRCRSFPPLPLASCRVMSCHAISCRVVSCHAISCRVMSCRLASGVRHRDVEPPAQGGVGSTLFPPSAAHCAGVLVVIDKAWMSSTSSSFRAAFTMRCLASRGLPFFVP